MVFVLVILTVVVFVLVDLALRLIMQRMREAKAQREREDALEVGLRLEISEEAPSLRRVEVPEPRARILAVDDEAIVLDSFRKILVLAGYSVDTVESGREALGLVKTGSYDFVFTDLKMPDMDGLDVTKAVKHLRPEIDVAMITGYATIDSAVDAMRFGAADYVEKPFTEDELVSFANRLLLRRQDRLERQAPPTVNLVTAGSKESLSSRAINVPGGLFVSPEHIWLQVETSGEIRVGLDDFVHKILGPFDEIEFPEKGKAVVSGQPLFTVKQGGRLMTFASPVNGKVSKLNEELIYHLDAIAVRPHLLGWICCLKVLNLAESLPKLRIGIDSLPWYKEEIERFESALKQVQLEGRFDAREREGVKESESNQLEVWQAFETSFLSHELGSRLGEIVPVG
jgi:CheY-like chemotaxis protein